MGAVEGQPPALQPTAARPTGTSGLAVASLVVGLLGICTFGLGGIVGLILGIMATINAKRDGKGQGVAIAGICASVVSLFVAPLLLVMAAIAIPTFAAEARDSAQNEKALASLRELAWLAEDYAADNDDSFPPAGDWVSALSDYVVDLDYLLTSPFFDSESGRAYAMNRALDGRRFGDVTDPSATVLFFESKIGSPFAGGFELLAIDSRYVDGYAVVYVDGHAENVPPNVTDNLNWEP